MLTKIMKNPAPKSKTAEYSKAYAEHLLNVQDYADGKTSQFVLKASADKLKLLRAKAVVKKEMPKRNPVDPKIYATPRSAKSRTKMVRIQCSADGVHYMNCGVERTIEAAKKKAHELDADSGKKLYFKLKV